METTKDAQRTTSVKTFQEKLILDVAIMKDQMMSLMIDSNILVVITAVVTQMSIVMLEMVSVRTK